VVVELLNSSSSRQNIAQNCGTARNQRRRFRNPTSPPPHHHHHHHQEQQQQLTTTVLTTNLSQRIFAPCNPGTARNSVQKTLQLHVSDWNEKKNKNKNKEGKNIVQEDHRSE
jgi:hypothetical protein